MGDRAPSGHLLSSNEASSPRIWLGIIECWPKVFHGYPQTTQAVAKTIGYSPQNDSKAPLLNTIPTQLNERGKAKSVPT